MKGFIYVCCVALFFIIILAIFHNNQNKELFTNNPIDIFTNDKCCTQKNIEECNKYGQTGVCNYQQNNKSCLCQNSF